MSNVNYTSVFIRQPAATHLETNFFHSDTLTVTNTANSDSSSCLIGFVGSFVDYYWLVLTTLSHHTCAVQKPTRVTFIPAIGSSPGMQNKNHLAVSGRLMNACIAAPTGLPASYLRHSYHPQRCIPLCFVKQGSFQPDCPLNPAHTPGFSWISLMLQRGDLIKAVW